MTIERRTLLGTFALAALVLTTGCVDFPPDPTICVTCELGVESATADRYNVSVGHSELHIRVRENGTARWTVRSNLTGPDVDAFQSDPERVDWLADRAVTGSVDVEGITHLGVHGGSVENVSARMTGDTLVVSFTVAGFAERGFGNVLLVDYFHTEAQAPASYSLGTDRLVVRGPPGTVVTNRPPTGVVTDGGQTVTWHPSDARVQGTTYVAFGTDRGRATNLATKATIGAAVAEWVAPRTWHWGIKHSGVLFATTVLLSLFFVGRSPVRIGDTDDSPLRRLASDPPVDMAVVMLVLAGWAVIAVADSNGVSQTLLLLITPLPLLPAGLFFLLGYSIEEFPRVSRSITVAIAGLPFVIASWHIATPVGYPLEADGVVYQELLLWTLIVLATGVPLFYAGYKKRTPE